MGMVGIIIGAVVMIGFIVMNVISDQKQHDNFEEEIADEFFDSVKEGLSKETKAEELCEFTIEN